MPEWGTLTLAASSASGHEHGRTICSVMEREGRILAMKAGLPRVTEARDVAARPSGHPRRQIATISASATGSLVIRAFIDHLTTRHENRSRTTVTYSQPSSVQTSGKSAIHFAFGRGAWKSRSRVFADRADSDRVPISEAEACSYSQQAIHAMAARLMRTSLQLTRCGSQ